MKGIQHFDMLKISNNASFVEAKRAYKQLVKVWHPDQFADRPDMQSVAQEKLKEINVAYREVTQILKERSKQEKEGLSTPHENIRYQERNIPEESTSSWHTFTTRFKKNLGDLRKFFVEKNKTAGGQHHKSGGSKDTGKKNRPHRKSTSLNFEKVLQDSLHRRSGLSKSYREKKELDARRKTTKGRIKTSNSRAYGIRSRSKRQTNGRIEAIRPIEKIKGIRKI
jgi:curved DNA-binding protein CbpA